MSEHPMDWDDFRFFSKLAHTRSVRAAAAVLAVNPSTVTRRLEQLEERLGVRLFTRSHSGLTITAEGAEVVEQLDRVAIELEEIERRLRGRDSDLQGNVRITMPDVFAVSLLMETFAGEQDMEFNGRHHEIYLSDPRRVPPERLKTILRHPVAKP